MNWFTGVVIYAPRVAGKTVQTPFLEQRLFRQQGQREIGRRCRGHGLWLRSFDLAWFSLRNITLQRGRGICRQRVNVSHRVCDHRVIQLYISRARATAATSSTHCCSNARVSGMVRTIPIGAQLTAPTPPNAVTSKNFSQKAL